MEVCVMEELEELEKEFEINEELISKFKILKAKKNIAIEDIWSSGLSLKEFYAIDLFLTQEKKNELN